MKKHVLILITIALAAGTLQAGNLYWSGNGSSQGGNGTWDTTNQRWGIGTGGPFSIVWTNANNDTAIFGSTAGTVTLGENVQVGGLQFSVSGYTITGAKILTFGVANPMTINAGTVTISGGAVVTNAGAVNVDSGSANTLVITNGGKLFSGGASISTTLNGVQVVGGIAGTSLWNLGGAALTFSGTAGSSGSLRIDGAGVAGSAVVTNVGNLLQGRSSHNSSILLTNGARMFVNGQVQMGSPYYDSYGVPQNNSITIMGGAANSIFCGSSNCFYVGYDDRPGVVRNSVIVGAGGVMTNVGYNSGNRNIDFVVGKNSPYGASYTQTSYSNQLVVTDGGQAFLLGNLSLGYIDGYVVSCSNTLLIANGGLVNVPGALNVGWANAASAMGTFNNVTITNGGQFFTGADSYIGRAAVNSSTSINNTATIAGVLNGTNATWNLGGKILSIGPAVSGATAISNSLTVGPGGVVTNMAILMVKATNSLTLGVGGQIFANTVTNLGAMAVGIDNTMTPTSGRLVVAGRLDVSGIPLNVNVKGSGLGIHIIATYGTLIGQFSTTNGLPPSGNVKYGYNGNQIAVLVPGQGTVIAVR